MNRKKDAALEAYGEYFTNRTADDIRREYDEQRDEWRPCGAPRMRRCDQNDLPRLTEFYRRVADASQYSRWAFGLHPTEAMIADYVAQGAAFVEETDGGIAAALAVTPQQPPEYREVSWRCALRDDEVAVVHLLAVDPRLQGRGLATALMREVLAQAKVDGKRAVRLDALATNLPAHRLYEALGFEKRGVFSWYAANTGQADFYLYEYLM